MKPENSRQWDIGTGFKSFSITYFRYSFRDKIDYNSVSGRYENLTGKTKINGIDASYSRFLPAVKSYIRINYTYLDSKDPQGKRLPRRALNQFGFDLVWYPDEMVNIGFSGVYVGKRKDTNNAQTGYYTVINSFANFNINKNLLAYVKINNITDKYYQTIDGYATEGRSLYAGMQLKW